MLMIILGILSLKYPEVGNPILEESGTQRRIRRTLQMAIRGLLSNSLNRELNGKKANCLQTRYGP